MRSLIVPLLSQGEGVGDQHGTIRMDARKHGTRSPGAVPPHLLDTAGKKTVDDATHGDASSSGQGDIAIGPDLPEHPPPEVSHPAARVVSGSPVSILIRAGNGDLPPPGRSVSQADSIRGRIGRYHRTLSTSLNMA